MVRLRIAELEMASTDAALLTSVVLTVANAELASATGAARCGMALFESLAASIAGGEGGGEERWLKVRSWIGGGGLIIRPNSPLVAPSFASGALASGAIDSGASPKCKRCP